MINRRAFYLVAAEGRYPQEFSGGQPRRLALERILLLRPRRSFVWTIAWPSPYVKPSS